MGLVPVTIQVDGMDDALRNSIWNFIRDGIPEDDAQAVVYVRGFTTEVLRISLDEMGRPYRWWLGSKLALLDWPRVYDALEYAVHLVPDSANAMLQANRILEREHS